MTTVGSSLSKADDGTPLTNRTVLHQVSGHPKHLTRAEFDAAIVAERARITANAAGLWQPDERFHIVNEGGMRLWTVATGGTSSQNAANSHARKVRIGDIVTYTLAADTNAVIVGTGAPTGGSTGDLWLGTDTGQVSLNSAGTWALVSQPTLTAAQIALVVALINGPPAVPISANISITGTNYSNYLNRLLDMQTGGLTITIAAAALAACPGLRFDVRCPSSGTVTIASDGTVLLTSTGGATTDPQTRTLAANAGFSVFALNAANIVAVTGA